jgi:hypothetical protein
MENIKEIFKFKWNPSRDLLVVLVSWLLVVGALYTATVVIGTEIAGGMLYFLLYAIVGALLFGIGIPVVWMLVVKKQPLSSLGITKKNLVLSLVMQIAFSILQFMGTLAKTELPDFPSLLPLIALALAIGFFEAVFWRGWVLQRLEDAFGFFPALLLGSLLYAFYHIGYGMPMSEIFFLFFIGLLYAVAFRLTKNIFILWPVFQPMGQLVTLIRDGLSLPPLAALGFIEVLIAMVALIFFVNRSQKKAVVKALTGSYNAINHIK